MRTYTICFDESNILVDIVRLISLVRLYGLENVRFSSLCRRLIYIFPKIPFSNEYDYVFNQSGIVIRAYESSYIKDFKYYNLPMYLQKEISKCCRILLDNFSQRICEASLTFMTQLAQVNTLGVYLSRKTDIDKIFATIDDWQGVVVIDTTEVNDLIQYKPLAKNNVVYLDCSSDTDKLRNMLIIANCNKVIGRRDDQFMALVYWFGKTIHGDDIDIDFIIG